MTYVSDNALCIVQDGLGNTISMHRVTITLTSTCHCNCETFEEEKRLSEEKLHLNRKSDENQRGYGSIYVVDKIVQHVGSKSDLQYVIRWYRSSKTDDTPNHPPRTRTLYRCVLLKIE